jgi:hypothetical protein
MEQTGTPSRLTGAVQSLATDVVSALRSGDHGGVLRGTVTPGAGEGLGLAAIRVLGADSLLPPVLTGAPADPGDVAVFARAVRAYPPGAGASLTARWSHWGMTRTLRRLDCSAPGGALGQAPGAGVAPGPAPVPGSAADRPGYDGPGTGPDAAPADRPGPGTDAPRPAAPAGEDRAGPGTEWTREAGWQELTHRLALLASLAVPTAGCPLAEAAARRSVDVARGFVRAVRRRDWLQAAGAGRWLAVLPDVPESLGLDGGLEFVSLMGAGDARVVLHVQAARLLMGAAG